jgi:hypothetical protein
MKKLVLLLILPLFGKVFAQNDAAALQSLLVNDSSSLRILFSYPDSVRQDIFAAATYPQGFTRLSEISKASNASFQKLASGYNQKRQKQLWEISRYPKLPSLLIANKDKKKAQLDALLNTYPEETRKAADYFVKHTETLAGMEKIRLDFEMQYNGLVSDFPPEIRKSFTALLADPELLSLMSEDLRTTVSLGDIYKRNPKLLYHMADSVYLQIAGERGEEYEDWKTGIRKDTAVQKELREVSKKYASEEDNTDDVYESATQKNVTFVLSTPPYPYWAGYPGWYAYPYWRPYPWWYNAGFYWDPYGSMIFLGLPSYQFGWWYYGHPHYYNHYTRTSRYFDQHYQVHPRSQSGFNRGIRDYNYGAPRNAPRGTPGRSGGGGRRR